MKTSTPSEPIRNVMKYLSEHMSLSKDFNIGLLPLLEPQVQEGSDFIKIGDDGKVLAWLETGYARCYRLEEDKDQVPVEISIDFYRSQRLLMVSQCFFSEEKCNYSIDITPGAVIIPFTRALFDELKITAPEIERLANHILSRDKDEAYERMAMMRLSPAERFLRFVEIFGIEIFQYFQQKQIATYIGISRQHLCNLRSAFMKTVR